MASTRKLSFLLLLGFLCSTSSTNAIQGRGFIGVVNPEDSGLVDVDKATADALRSGLTTVFLPIVYIVVLVVGLPANLMALWVFLFRTKVKHPAAIYMANLALSDVLFVIWTPLKIAYHINGNDWIYGEGLCKVLIGFFYGNMYCSILFIACLSVQRYWGVAHPMSHQRKNNTIAVAVSVTIWAFVWLTTTPLYLYDHTAKLKDPNITTCHDVNVIHDLDNAFQDVKYPFYYFILMAVVAFLVPCLVIVVVYILLLRVLSDSMDDDGSSSGKNRQRAVVLIVTVLVTFLVCFVPSNVMLVVHYSLLKDGVVNNGYAFYLTTLCLASLNSCLDPFIYYYVSEDFREHVKNTLQCRSQRTVERMTVSFNSMKYSKKSKAYLSESGTTQSSSC
ncbi:coagulation factor II (thrombin) receptor-like 1, tandem duplicate 2 [Hypomesus transpacificus]|uniref:coagulation factor II (thrombin) receptor-like 1, tandem duplicate 2 n=1 Tax=Hypomesus transpacificus TaxID=137520 RepID=UPI001F086BE8|nr:coagulation factor II (thrombin) receptor-like 1, tandem duplicate 2 [Hypomesus transpacificus]